MSECGVAFPCFYLVFICHQKIDVVETIHQAVLLVAIDVELLRTASGLVGHRLVGQVDLYFGLRILLDAVEELSKEVF